ncbi:hypothetical protein YC2023_116010 [Brassica napus]
MWGQHPYCGLHDKNPSDHIETLEDFLSGIQEDKATKDYIICKLFKFSLSGNAKKWLRCLPPGSLTTWIDVTTAFMTEFLDDARAEEMRDKIWTFSQGPTEAFKSSWERFRGYQRDYPHHGFTEIQLLKNFYKGIDVRYHMMLDTASEGNFETRTPEEAKRLIETLMSINSSNNLDMHRRKSAAMDSDKIVEAEIGSVHEVSLVEQDVEKDENKDHIQMMEKILKIQQKTSAYLNLRLDVLYKEMNGKFETLDAHVMMLDAQVSQTAEAVKKQEALIKGKAVENERHQVNAISDDDFGEVLEQEKLEEDAFLVESSISIGSSYWCRSTLTTEHQSTPTAEHRSTSSDEHRSTPLLGSDKTVPIQSHSDFAARHPHPPTLA